MVEQIRADVLRGLTPLITDQAAALPPEIVVSADGDDVGLALVGDADCVLARRVAGSVEVRYPPSTTVQPGELSCSPETALAGLAMDAPH